MRNPLIGLLLLAACGSTGPSSPLVAAARAGDVAAIERLLAQGAPVEQAEGVNGWTPLMHAIHKGQTAAALRLLAASREPDAKADRGVTALILAAGEGNLAVTQALLARGADPRARTSSGATALENALAGGHADVARALLQRDPGLNLGGAAHPVLTGLLARLHGESELLARVR